MKKCCYFLVFVLLGFSCTREHKADSFTIRGQFSNSRREKIVLYELDVKEIVALDSAITSKDGEFNFSHKTDQPGFFVLMFPDGRRIILLLGKGEILFITGNLGDRTGEFNLSGSEGSQILKEFFRATMKNRVRIDSVKRALRSREGSVDFLRFSMTADSVFNRISEDQKKLEKDFIDRNPKSLASLIVLNYSFGPKPVLTLEEDLPYYRKLTGLFRIYPKNKHVLFHMARVSMFLNNLKNPVK